MGSGLGKTSATQEIWNLKAYRLEEKIDRLEGELRKLRTELDERQTSSPKQQKKAFPLSRPSCSSIAPTRTNRRRRLSSMCEADSGTFLFSSLLPWLRFVCGRPITVHARL